MKNKGQELSILIVNYNGSAFLENCIRGFHTQLESNNIIHEFLVIDNASTDNSVQVIKRIAESIPNIRPVYSAINHGFGKANNMLIEMAAFDTIVLLNNDTLALDLKALCEKAANSWLEKHTVYTCSILNADHTPQKNTFSYPRLFNVMIDVFLVKKIFYSAYKSFFKEGIQVANGYYSGCYLVMNRDLFLEAGGFDPEFFFYHEECDLFLRLEKLGIQKESLKDQIIHFGSGGKSISDVAFKNYYLNLARLLIKNNYGTKQVITRIFSVGFKFRVLLLSLGWKIPYSPFSHTYSSGTGEESPTNRHLIELHKNTLLAIQNIEG